MIQLIAFDWDDVFTTGSKEAYHVCYVQAAKDSGVAASEEEIVRVVDELWGRPHETVIRSFLAEQESMFDEVNKRYEAYIFTDIFSDHLSIVDGSMEMLERLREKYLLAIVSGIHSSLLKERIFPKFNVPDVFSKVITSTDLNDRSRGKPYPDMLEMVMEALGVEPGNTIFVGDAPGDIRMAKAAKALPVAVLTGQLDEEKAEKLGAAYILNTVTDVEDLLPKLV